MLKISDYAVAYGQSQVISGLNLTLAEGEIVALVGRNGMGKTTLMKSLIGMIPSCAGELEFAGTNITGLLSYQRVQHGIGFVPQGRMVFSTMTVEENIKTGIRQSRSLQVPEYLYDYFPVLKEMRKQVSITRAIRALESLEKDFEFVACSSDCYSTAEIFFTPKLFEFLGVFPLSLSEARLKCLAAKNSGRESADE
ncbi:ATP-binding cassette domain-containing protein [Klebsiella pneumoniae]